MDTLGWYGLVSVVAIVIAIGLRFIVYTALVRNSRWLPEKATKVANTTSVVTIVVSLVVIVAYATLTGHTTH